MAKIHKISGYLVDPNGAYGEKHFRKMLFNNTSLIGQQIHIESKDIGDWDDNNPLNYYNCDLAECEKHFPKDPTKGKEVRAVKIGAIYRHFKGHDVKVLAVSEDTEYVGSYVVVYEHLGDNSIWHRPYDMFVSEVDHEKYPEVLQRYRFEEVQGND